MKSAGNTPFLKILIIVFEYQQVLSTGFTTLGIRYNKAWHKSTGLPLYWIKGAGHNSNTDKPEEVNALIEELARKIKG